MSSALVTLQSGAGPGLPMAMIAGKSTFSNLASLDTCVLCWAPVFRQDCRSSSLAQSLTSTGWPGVLGGDSDSIVPLTSQLNNLFGTTEAGLIHSSGLLSLGFTGPSELEQFTNVTNDVITNEHPDSVFHHAALRSGRLAKQGDQAMTVQALSRQLYRTLMLVALIQVCASWLNAQPTLQITSPSDGAAFSPGQTITVTVTASANRFTPRRTLLRASSLKRISFAAMFPLPPSIQLLRGCHLLS